MSLSMAPAPGSGLVSGWGMRIASAVRIPGALPCPDDGRPADVTVTVGPRCTDQPGADLYQWDGAALDFAPPGVARYRITRQSIDIRPCPGATRAAIAGLLVATAFPALLWLRDRFVLHAAGVARSPGGAALAIAGPSGAGKSTLARQLLRGGASLIGDDTLAIAVTAQAAECQGLPGGVFHGPASRRRFAAVADLQPGLDQPAPLSAILVLAAGEDAAIRPLAGVAAFDALMQNRHRPSVPAILGHQQAVMDAASAMCRAAQVLELRFDKRRHAPQELSALIFNLLLKD